MYSALQLHLPAAASHFGVEDMSAAASTSGSPTPMSYYHHHAPAPTAQYAPVPAIPQELLVDPGLYYQDHGHGQLHPMPFVTVDLGRAGSPQSQTADALSSGSHSPYAHSPYGTPEWQPEPVPALPVEGYYLPPALDYDWTAQASAYPVLEDARAQLTINTSLSVSYTAPASFYSHPSSATSASSGSPVSFHAPSPLSSEPESAAAAAAPARAPASGPTRGGRRKAAASPGAPKKVHKCTLCQKTMSRNYDLHRHLLSVHGIGDRVDADGVDRKAGWCCHACGKCFSRKDSMQRHQRDDGCRAQSAHSRSTSADRDEHLHLHLRC